jgi:hypothetical protein
MTKIKNLTEKQASIIAKLEAAGINARWWGRSDAGERIYLNGHGRRDVKVWIDFDDAADVRGATLKVRIDDCGQHPSWYAGQRTKFMADYAEAFQIVTGQSEAEKTSAAVTELQAEALSIGTTVSFFTGGEPSDSNPEMQIDGTVTAVRREAAPKGTIGQDHQVIVELDNGYSLYTWRGVLRYGGGAQVVRAKSLKAEG